MTDGPAPAAGRARRRPSLRARLVVSLVLTAAGVLALAGATTFLIVQTTAEDAALDDLRDKAETLERQAATTREIIVGEADAATRAGATDDSSLPQTRAYLTAVARLLDLAEARVVFVGSDGDIVERPPGARRPLRRATAVGAEALGLPDSLEAADLDTDRLTAGETVSGSRGSIVYLAQPVGDTLVPDGPQARAVVVLVQRVETNVIGRALPAFLVAAAVALAVTVGVSTWLARRLTRSLRAAQDTAQRLAEGDLGARVEVDAGAEEELAALAASLNAMAAELEQARGAERAFLLSVSHDLRTPLTSIRGYAEAITDGTLDDADPQERARAAAVIASEARRLERLVRDLLDLARLDTRQFSLRPRDCDAASVVREAAEGFAPAAADLGLALGVATDPPSFPALVDPERLGQIVANLVENALRFARSSVEVTVAAAGGSLELAVVDDGPGIPPEEAPRVFERLYTVRESPGRSLGTGLGLAIVRELAQAMGGTTRLEAPAGRCGSRFVVAIPARPAAVGGATP